MGWPPSRTGSSPDPMRRPCWVRGRSIRPGPLPAWAQAGQARPTGKGRWKGQDGGGGNSPPQLPSCPCSTPLCFAALTAWDGLLLTSFTWPAITMSQAGSNFPTYSPCDPETLEGLLCLCSQVVQTLASEKAKPKLVKAPEDRPSSFKASL